MAAVSCSQEGPRPVSSSAGKGLPGLRRNPDALARDLPGLGLCPGPAGPTGPRGDCLVLHTLGRRPELAGRSQWAISPGVSF